MIKTGIPRFRASRLPSPGETNRIAVIGLGNVLFSDEGVGVATAAELSKRFTFSPAIDIVDGGTMGLDLLPFFQDRDRIVIIDAVDFGKEPGHAACLNQDEIRSVLNPKLSVHHVGLADLLLAAKLTRMQPLDLCLIGIQPGSLAVGLRMTRAIEQSVDKLVDIAVRKLESWNVTASGMEQQKRNQYVTGDLTALPPSTL